MGDPGGGGPAEPAAALLPDRGGAGARGGNRHRRGADLSRRRGGAGATGGQPLVCPACGGAQPDSERFCPECGLPLVHSSLEGGGASVEGGEDERHRLARKIDPRYVEGDLTRVIWARNQTEAEFIQGLLLEEGIPSMLRRSRGFDVPDFLASGPRDVLVPASGLSAARDVLMQSDLISDRATPAIAVPWHVMAALLVALAIVAIVLVIATRL